MKEEHDAQTGKDALPNRIQQEILQSGFPLEMYVLNICGTANTGRMPSYRYRYEDRLRELDLLAFFETIGFGSGKLIHLVSNLVIECKKSEEKPWVFFSTPSYSFPNALPFLRVFSDVDTFLRNAARSEVFEQRLAKLKANHYLDRSVRRCIAYMEAFKKPSLDSEIYRAIESVASYCRYRQDLNLKRQQVPSCFVEVHYPVIVLDGFLYEAQVDSGVTITERQHLQLRTFLEDDVYVLDIVTRQQFSTLFKTIQANHDEMVQLLASVRLPRDIMEAARKYVRRTRLTRLSPRRLLSA